MVLFHPATKSDGKRKKLTVILHIAAAINTQKPVTTSLEQTKIQRIKTLNKSFFERTSDTTFRCGRDGQLSSKHVWSPSKGIV